MEKMLSPHNSLVCNAMESPAFRTSLAVQNGVEKNLLFKTWGGLGDQICAEPTLRYALKKFSDCTISLATEHPNLFRHLNFKYVFDLKEVQPNWDKYLVFDTIKPQTDILWEFMSHMLINCVDYPAICAIRSQLPIASREVKLVPTHAEFVHVRSLLKDVKNPVAIHAGKHWPSKTFPKWWWDKVLENLIACGATPVLIGADTDDNRSTVEVDTTGCLDLRNNLPIMDSVALLHSVGVLITNDSSPLHMAASSPDTWIAFVATCKHPDFIGHWRQGEWMYRMKNFGKSGVWDIISECPNAINEVSAEHVPEDILVTWLPDPGDIAQWAYDKTSIK